MNWTLIIVLSAIGILLYIGLNIAEKVLVKKRAKKVIKDDNRASANADQSDRNE